MMNSGDASVSGKTLAESRPTASSDSKIDEVSAGDAGASELTERPASAFAEIIGVVDRPLLAPQWGRNLWTANVVCALALIAVSVIVGMLSAGYGFGTMERAGAGFFPGFAALLGGILGCIWLLQGLAGRIRSESKLEMPDRDGALAIVATVIIILGFGELVKPVGFVVTAAVALGLLLVIVARRNWWVTLAISVVFSLGVYITFKYVLGIELPESGIPFLKNFGL